MFPCVLCLMYVVFAGVWAYIPPIDHLTHCFPSLLQHPPLTIVVWLVLQFMFCFCVSTYQFFYLFSVFSEQYMYYRLSKLFHFCYYLCCLDMYDTSIWRLVHNSSKISPNTWQPFSLPFVFLSQVVQIFAPTPSLLSYHR
ncbi:hypothetical protein F5890DRAFT_1296785 [Lentinula detonsa]|uniref:Uncharacterized protein n=1 Tax=Lentinula detonsa TaxID=2804962 RepID=A0AA38PZ21_9AGAR|nr:hypothetical protein F5890DRAFT_1296785 [Lentinula detonsa]